jgi:hypothetical protein
LTIKELLTLKIGDIVKKRPVTPTYILFYILFLPDSWRILIGVVFSGLLSSLIFTPEIDFSGRVVIYIMMVFIGYSATGVPARWITGVFKKLILGDKRPSKK